MNPKFVVILGPTGVGKSDTAVWVALQFDGEIISADSIQVYRRMEIGTGKPSLEIRGKVPHHLMDLVDPDEEFNAARFRESALQAAGQIQFRRKKVVICGGTGLYIKALTHGLFVGPGRSVEIRRGFEEDCKNKGLSYLYERLRKQDPDATLRIHPNDRQRIVRALEVYALTGKRISQWQRDHGFREAQLDVLKIGLERDRKELYALIDRRCEDMVDEGLVDEVRGLIDGGYSLELSPLQSVGYRQIGFYLKGEMGLDEALSLMKRDTRRLAKRQLTWFRADKEIRWFHPEKDRNKILESVHGFLSNTHDS